MKRIGGQLPRRRWVITGGFVGLMVALAFIVHATLTDLAPVPDVYVMASPPSTFQPTTIMVGESPTFLFRSTTLGGTLWQAGVCAPRSPGRPPDHREPAV